MVTRGLGLVPRVMALHDACLSIVASPADDLTTVATRQGSGRIGPTATDSRPGGRRPGRAPDVEENAMTETPAHEYLLVEDDGSIYGVLAAADVERAYREALGRG